MIAKRTKERREERDELARVLASTVAGLYDYEARHMLRHLTDQRVAQLLRQLWEVSNGRALLALALALMAGCTLATDFERFNFARRGHQALDAGHLEADAGRKALDAGELEADAGHEALDAGQLKADAGHEALDAGQLEADAGKPCTLPPAFVAGRVYGPGDVVSVGTVAYRCRLEADAFHCSQGGAEPGTALGASYWEVIDPCP